jgi:hypothetical protein
LPFSILNHDWLFTSSGAQRQDNTDRSKLKGNIHHSVSAWCCSRLFNPDKAKWAKMSFEGFCHECYRMGLESVELLK